MSRDFELGRNVSCEESTISPVRGLFIIIIIVVIFMSSQPDGVGKGVICFWLSVRPFVGTDLVTTIFHERLEQSQ